MIDRFLSAFDVGPRRGWMWILVWASIGLGLFIVISGVRLPERMGCEYGSGGRGNLNCRYSLISAEAWRKLP